MNQQELGKTTLVGRRAGEGDPEVTPKPPNGPEET